VVGWLTVPRLNDAHAAAGWLTVPRLNDAHAAAEWLTVRDRMTRMPRRND